MWTMGNCGSGSRKSKPEEIVDLERIVLEIARQRVSTGDLTFAEKLCLEKCLFRGESEYNLVCLPF